MLLKKKNKFINNNHYAKDNKDLQLTFSKHIFFTRTYLKTPKILRLNGATKYTLRIIVRPKRCAAGELTNLKTPYFLRPGEPCI